MSTASAIQVPAPTQSPTPVDASRIEGLRTALQEKLGRIRSLMVASAPHGFQTRVAELMNARKERISRELGSVEKLSVELVLAEVALHRAEGRPEHADRLLAALNEGEPVHLQTSGALVIRLRDGQMFLDLEAAR